MSKTKKNTVFQFEKGLEELEKIVEQMECGNSTLEASLEQFSRAVSLLKDCQLTLKKAEQRVQILVNTDTNQKKELLPFQAEELV
ncbi:exodeoxyribonuclease VII small subunit [Candidatus Rickettsiella isopodorum]|jgi:exodeoxyribonuclease VII small subunit|uniref:Exodeoxyribonuclease 7 small subunit n=1 Tax=Candidatus Rickettsiella isopodorum TaxID=1225476 RepID=A0A1J8P7L0_9COXI|nr:exodeoxyribonuclease VII small subunit [Candidatus Rickettsiella isopodorum]MDD5161315.1 exodeoxyribonuclease VII small subunit [Candidatus Rickettsiella isopodorum]MDQ5899809.1 exodeoxyribonuclease small subunit [Pseudomonadota bacterium]OIZ95772.1 exodeoxyribonuclease VII small subunit [Candidatus Rickettsiella isopodorum]